jgi:hypothetical protein
MKLPRETERSEVFNVPGHGSPVQHRLGTSALVWLREIALSPPGPGLQMADSAHLRPPFSDPPCLYTKSVSVAEHTIIVDLLRYKAGLVPIHMT